MATFRVVLIEHGYSTTRYERDVVEAAGGGEAEASRRDRCPASAV
jgi:hypothetical protein